MFQILCNRSSFSKYFCGHENGRLWFLVLAMCNMVFTVAFCSDWIIPVKSHMILDTGSHLSVTYSSYNYNQYIKKSRIKISPVYKLTVCLLHVYVYESNIQHYKEFQDWSWCTYKIGHLLQYK